MDISAVRWLCCLFRIQVQDVEGEPTSILDSNLTRLNSVRPISTTNGTASQIASLRWERKYVIADSTWQRLLSQIEIVFHMRVTKDMELSSQSEQI